MKRRLAFALLCALALAGCGGGGHSTATPPVASTTGSAGSQKPIGTASLTIKLPAGFHIAKPAATATAKPALALSARTPAAATPKRPTYVDSNSAYIDIWVVTGNTIVHSIDSSGGPNLTPNPDGTQTFSIPIFTTATTQIVAMQTTGAGTGLPLAMGEADIGAFTPGTPVSLSLTMLMVAAHIGAMTDPDNRNSDASTAPSFNTTPSICAPGTSVGPFYFFTTDAANGFISPSAAGIGGVAQPTIVGTTSDGGTNNTFSSGAGVSPGSSVTYNAITSGMSVKLTSPNPAYALASGAVFGTGLFPGAAFLYNSGVAQPQFIAAYSTGSTISTTIDILPSRTCTQGFNIVGTEQDFVVPAGVTAITFTAAGAQGSGGGSGGTVTATIPVTPLETLAMFIGGWSNGATGGYNGGGDSGGFGCNSGGGGSTDVRRGGNLVGNRVFVAGGGGGGGCDNGGGGAAGGNGGHSPSAGGDVGLNFGAGGGGGGGAASLTGGGTSGAAGNGPQGFGGGGGTGSQPLGGTGGAGNAGGYCAPPAGCGSGIGGAGGGGGYWGGGGGGGGGGNSVAQGLGGGGGGGGSSWVEPSGTNITYTDGNQSGNGYVTLTYSY